MASLLPSLEEADEEEEESEHEDVASLASAQAPKAAAGVRQEDLAGGAANIRVAIRIRPFSAHEEAEVGHAVPVVRAAGNDVVLRTTTGHLKEDKIFSYDHVFSSMNRDMPEYASQARVFEQLGVPILENAFNAFNGCLLAYGQTGSGKSYSILGDPGCESEKGLLPRACEELFEQIARRRLEAEAAGALMQATVLVSYLEIYQDKLRDLLVSMRTDLQVRIHPTLGPHVPSLTESPVASMNQVQELLDFGSTNRVVAATLMNAQSSRSHAVFTIELRLNISGKDQQSKIHFVDLAGSEKQKKTDAAGERLSEGIAINQSLTTLSRCIMALSASAGSSGSGRRKSTVMQPPFRESKLTLLLKEALSGNSRTVLVACISPSEMNMEESLGTLEFASRCKLIKTSAKRNEQSKKDLVENLSAEKSAVEAALQHQLAQRRALQEELQQEVEHSKESQEFARKMEEEKRAVEQQLRLLELARAERSSHASGHRRRSVMRAATNINVGDFMDKSKHEWVQLRREKESKDAELRREKEQQLPVLQELQRSKEAWEEERRRELEHHKQLANEVERMRHEREKQVSEAETERQKVLDELEQAQTQHERENDDWLRLQQQSEKRAEALQEMLLQQEVSRAERERLEWEQQEVQVELQRVCEEKERCRRDAECLRRGRTQALAKVEEGKDRAMAQLRDLGQLQKDRHGEWERLLAEKEREAEALQREWDAAAEEVAREHSQLVERLEREKAQELSQADAEHSRTVAQFQARLAEMEEMERAVRESLVERQARELDLRREVEMDFNRHASRVEELEHELRGLQSLSDSWALQRQDLEARALDQKQDRERLLKELGIVGVDAHMTDSRKAPRLVNLHQDPMLEGCLVYYLPQGETCFGAGGQRCHVRLAGLDADGEVCAVVNQADGQLTIRALKGGLVRVNGLLVSEAGQALRDGDRLAIGRLHIFRAVVPGARQRRPSVSAAREREFDQAMRELQCAEIDGRWRRRVDAAILMAKAEFGTGAAKALLDTARAASEAIVEADALIRALGPQPEQGTPVYELVVLFEADAPPRVCIVCRCADAGDSLAGIAEGLGADARVPPPRGAGANVGRTNSAGRTGTAGNTAHGRGWPRYGCSLGLWEASRFAAERLPQLRRAAEAARHGQRERGPRGQRPAEADGHLGLRVGGPAMVLLHGKARQAVEHTVVWGPSEIVQAEGRRRQGRTVRQHSRRQGGLGPEWTFACAGDQAALAGMARPSKTAGPPVPIVRACTAVRLGALVGLLLGHASGGGTRGALFGDSCNGTTPLAEGLCCCAVSSLVAYGKQLTYLSSCADSSACTGNHTGFCAKRQHEGAPANWKLATNDFCQFVCPCCAGVPAGTVEGRRLGETPAQPRDLHQTARALGQEPQAPADGAAALAQFEEGGRFLKSARLSEQWVQEGAVALFDTSSSDFHKSLMGSVTANHTLQEFYDVKYGSPSWALLSKMRRAHNWDEGELAIFLYTTEWPQIYAPMNKLLREATSLEDIDEYWQSYMAILKHGLETYARYVEVDTWRGVSCDAVDALPVGSTGVLPSFTSTSTEHRVASSFGCTVLHFTGGGYDIQEYSHFPGEAEVLLEQGRSYRVTKGGEGERRLTLETPGPQVMKRPEITEAAGQVPITNCSRMDHSICPVCSCCQKAPRAILESLEASSPAPSPSRVPGDSLLAALGQRAAEVAPDMTAHEVARVLRAYGELGEQPGDRLLAALGWRATQVAGNMTARDVVDTFQAYARIGQPLGAPVLAAVERRAKAVAKQMNAPDVAIMLDSYAKLKAEENIPGPGSRG